MTDPFATLGNLRVTTTVALATLGLRVERLLAESGEGGERIVQIIVSAIPEWEPGTVTDGDFEVLIKQDRKAERQQRAQTAAENLEELRRQLDSDGSDGGFL